MLCEDSQIYVSAVISKFEHVSKFHIFLTCFLLFYMELRKIDQGK